MLGKAISSYVVNRNLDEILHDNEYYTKEEISFVRFNKDAIKKHGEKYLKVRQELFTEVIGNGQ